MEEIKFRAWNIKKKEMIYWRLFDCEPWKSTPAQHLRPMQFTGLLDKNGKEIYEVDLVYIAANDTLHKVVYSGCNASFMLERVRDPFKSSLYPMDCEEEYEVIGNIYENPDLLR